MDVEVRITKRKSQVLHDVDDVIENVSKKRLTLIFEDGEQITFLPGAWQAVNTHRVNPVDTHKKI